MKRASIGSTAEVTVVRQLHQPVPMYREASPQMGCTSFVVSFGVCPDEYREYIFWRLSRSIKSKKSTQEYEQV